MPQQQTGQNQSGVIRTLFLSAALFNLVIGVSFLIAPRAVFQSMTGLDLPIGAEGVLYVLAAAVLAFALGYYWIFLDYHTHRVIVRLAVYGKALAFLLALWAYGQGGFTLLGLAGASIDLVYAALFALSLKLTAKSQG